MLLCCRELHSSRPYRLNDCYYKIRGQGNCEGSVHIVRMIVSQIVGARNAER